MRIDRPAACDASAHDVSAEASGEHSGAGAHIGYGVRRNYFGFAPLAPGG